jgi:hypothetical protein
MIVGDHIDNVCDAHYAKYFRNMRTQLNLASTFCANTDNVVRHEKRYCQAHADDNIAIVMIVGNYQTAHSIPRARKANLPGRPVNRAAVV